MLLGVCKLLALLDLWVVNAIPRVTCLCVACMMGAPSATYHGVLASHQYLCRVLAHTGHAHACILTGLPTDLAGLVTYCHHAIADDLPPPALMCADMLHIRCTHTHGARHLVLTASLSTRGCNPTHKRLQRVRMRVSAYNSTPRPMRAPCVLRAPCYHHA